MWPVRYEPVCQVLSFPFSVYFPYHNLGPAEWIRTTDTSLRGYLTTALPTELLWDIFGGFKE